MENIRIIKTQDDKECILIKKDNKEKALGSKYNFKNDLNKLTSEINTEHINIETTIIILGLYNGEYLKDIKEQVTSKNRVIIFEFNEEIYEKYKSKVAKEFEIYLYNNDLDLNKINISSLNFKIITFGNYEKLYEERCNKIYKFLKEVIINIKIEKNTLNKFSDAWFECAINNTKVMLKNDRLLRFKDYYKGYPAIIVSAGPSLEKNIKTLKKLQDKAIIISGGRTLKPLLDNNIKPTFVCVVDPGEGSYIVIKEALNCDTPLVVNEVSNFNVVNEYKGNKIFYNNNLIIDFYEHFIGNKENTFLFAGGSVVHASTDLARYLGCKEIVFVGQDLAYTNNNKHANIANHAKSNLEDNFDLLVDDITGGKVGTSYLLNDFRKNLEKYIKIYKNSIKFINATEGGANIIGTEVKTLKEVVKRYKDKSNFKNIDFKAYFNDNDKKIVKDKFKTLLIDLRKIKKMSNDVLESNNKFLKYYKSANINKYISQLENNESKVMKYIDSLKVINIVLIPVIDEILKSNEYIPKKETTYDEKIKLNYLQTQKLYSEIITKIDFCIDVIITALGENIEKL